MSEAIVDTIQIHSNSSDAKTFDICWESDEEMQLEHYGLSAIKKSSGIICWMCMKFFLDDIAAEDHARNLFHYQHYCIALQEKEKDCNDHILGTFYASEYSYEEDCFEAFCTSEIEENISNNELVTISKCYGILCSACKQFFVSEVSAGQHVKSWAHYRRCYGWSMKDVTQKATNKKEKLFPRNCEDNSICMEMKQNVEPVLFLKNGEKHDFLDVHCDMKHSLMSTRVDDEESLEEGEIKDGESEESVLDSLSSGDNDWWHDFDETLATLLHDIHNDNGEYETS
ncbi:hypothetical protein R5R35_000688 [Gryllus longicercus]|uniref:C2H2-type domain-containing protein n=1 Tax=Gryllus longicercus TaxID=2509291 RepID=A0AAN9VQE7_9ORTH